ncbi:hypothetical protein ABCV69_004615 [Pseudomonas aeruginosa]|nr:hypothetical protein [Pseudomonas aeruginosa]ELJ2277952.1 hypothetical protein [Pseudomonas aeruginosa]MBS2052436.1 hypothetical protein [Pseudomonas aeruginosa]HBP0221326.1 hypothetical protein [Pseudomonas aeruginosa]HBP0254494.1 hypothetical protein [Pseudomonas aeruginosa]
MLLAFGAAPYKFEKDESASFYVQLQLPTGETKTLWGVGLEKALEDSGVQLGEVMTAQNLGRQPVEVDIKVRDEDGKLTGEVRREVVHRNVWSVMNAPELDWRRDAEQKEQPDQSDSEQVDSGPADSASTERAAAGADATSTDQVFADAGNASAQDAPAVGAAQKDSARAGTRRDKRDRSPSRGGSREGRAEPVAAGAQQHGAVGAGGGLGPDLVSKAFSAPFNVATALGGLFSTSFKEVGHKFTARSVDGYGVLEGQLSDLASAVERKATWLKSQGDIGGQVAPGAAQTAEDLKRLLGDFDSLSGRFADLGSKLGYDYAETLDKHSTSMKSALDKLDGKSEVIAELQELVRKLVDKLERLFSNIKMSR